MYFLLVITCGVTRFVFWPWGEFQQGIVKYSHRLTDITQNGFELKIFRNTKYCRYLLSIDRSLPVFSHKRIFFVRSGDE